jgi:hypothetical protein
LWDAWLLREYYIWSEIFFMGKENWQLFLRKEAVDTENNNSLGWSFELSWCSWLKWENYWNLHLGRDAESES